MDYRNQILSWIEEEETQLVTFLQNFIKAKSPNPPGNTIEVIKFIKAHLEKYDVPFRVVAPQPKMPNLVGSFKGSQPGKHLVLNGHVDVFPVSKRHKEQGWKVNPWSGEMVNGRIYGRGSTDMKCGTSASIWTFIFLNRLKNILKGQLTLTCVSDEETFGPWGSRWLIDNEPEVVGDCCLNGEPSSPYTIRYGEKGLLWINFTIQTAGSHGAYTHLSKSATRIAVALINDLEKLEKLDTEQSSDMISAHEKAALALDKGMGKGASDIVSKITLNIGRIVGGLKNNMVPGECNFDADYRLPVGFDGQKIVSKIEQILKKYPEVKMTVNMLNPPSNCDPNGQMSKIIQDNVFSLKGYRPTPVISLGGTDARLWRYKGIPAYVYGPSPIGMGSSNENVSVEDYLHVIRTHALSAFDYLAT